MTNLPWTKKLSLLLYLILLILLTVKAWSAIQLTAASPALVLAVSVLPVALFLPWILRSGNRPWIWMSFVLCAYFLEPVVQLVAGDRTILNSLLVTNLIALFVSIMIQLKHAQKRPAVVDY